MNRSQEKTGKIEYIIGIDEAGRGALAGPVAVGMFVWPLSNGRPEKFFADYPFGRDSKKLSAAQRVYWFERILDSRAVGAFAYVSFVGNKRIDKVGIVGSVVLGINNCLAKSRRFYCQGNTLTIEPAEVLVLLDGGLVAPEAYINQKTIIKGDEKELVISLASIAAKVSRDRKMTQLSVKYPDYGIDGHKGYGTRNHCQLIAKFGHSDIHRLSFMKSLLRK